MIRHQEYLDRREKRMVITYHDNIFVPSDQEDIQLLALQQGLLMLKNLYQDKFEVIVGFYYGNYKTIKAYAANCGISRQAMSKKLHKALEILRHICFETYTVLIAATRLQTATIRRQFLFSGCVYF